MPVVEDISSLGEMCSKAQEISLSITTDLLRFLHQLQINPSTETQRSLEDRAIRIQEFRNHIDSSFLQLADLCSRIHLAAPQADRECTNILTGLSHKDLKAGHVEQKPILFDKVLAEHRENKVEFFTLKAELDIVNREIGNLINDFRNVLTVIDASENSSAAMLGLSN